MNIPFHPDTASTIAPEVNLLFYTLVGFSFLLVAFLGAQVVYYAIRYRRGARIDRSGARRRSLPLEIGWTSATIIVAFGLFAWGANLFLERERLPPDAIEIIGLAKQWMWRFEHAGGQREINALHIPVDRPILVELGSEDVIHSLFIPAFRIKQDAVPGMSTRVWFEATKTGRFVLFCAEYCGTRHSGMRGKVVVMEQDEFTDWLDAQGSSRSIIAQGEALFRDLGCSGCHGASQQVRAPDLTGIYGRPVALERGETVIADERFIRDSILQPDRDIAAGYASVMPSFEELISEAELQRLVAYLKSLATREEQ